MYAVLFEEIMPCEQQPHCPRLGVLGETALVFMHRKLVGSSVPLGSMAWGREAGLGRGGMGLQL